MKVSCSKCGSSDGVEVYEDHDYCFVCNTRNPNTERVKMDGNNTTKHTNNPHNEADSVFTYDPSEEVSNDIFHRFAAVPVRSRDALIRYGTVYSPNALGGGLDAETMKVLVPGDIVCGGANNQFCCDEMDVAYAAAGITVVPDFLANAGGIIIVKEGMKDASYMDSDVMDKLKQIKFTTEEVLWRARDEKYSPMHIAKVMAEERFK